MNRNIIKGKHCYSVMVLAFLFQFATAQKEIKTFLPNHPLIRYMGRISFADPMAPVFWQPGVQISFTVKGSRAAIILEDEQLWGSNQNYLELEIDGRAIRLQTKGRIDTIRFDAYLKGSDQHLIRVMKNTEANIGYLKLKAIQAEELLPTKEPLLKIECIGNSITCGTGSDTSAIPCGKGKWQDQHNAYYSYGVVLARSLDASVHLSSVSGIGLMHSCCNLPITMPQVFDKICMRNDTIPWNFKRYIPDILTICLGQNDGIQDSAIFVSNYLKFLATIRKNYPSTQIILLTSPMADPALRNFMKNSVKSVVKKRKAMGDRKIGYFVFEKQYAGGCDSHPSISEHREIASLLKSYIQKTILRTSR